HLRVLEHEQRVVSIDAGIGVQERASPSAHEGFSVMRRVLQAARLQLLSKHATEQKAVFRIGIVVGDEDRMTLKSVAEPSALAVVLPSSEKPVRHRVVVDGQQKVRRQVVGASHTSVQASICPPVGHHKDRFGKPRFEESLVNLLGEAQIEIKFINTTCAFGTW